MNGKQLAVLVAFIGAAALILSQNQGSKVTSFESWKAQHGIVYTSQFENTYRERVFLENLAKIEAHNAQNGKTYEQGLNQFSAMTQEEFAQTYLTLNVPKEYQNIEAHEEHYVAGDIDWVAQGYVTDVKNQGQCGSCWAFSTTGGLEGLSKAKGALESFSESQLVDCSGSYGNQACNGGLMTNALKYVKDHGLVHEDEYPYKPVKQTCKINQGPFKVSGYTEIKNCNDLGNGIQGKVVSVAVDASNWSAYRGGVFNNCRTQLNHGVTLVGVKDGNWWVKNSWGASWGEKGFIRLASGNTCGICNMAVFPNA